MNPTTLTDVFLRLALAASLGGAIGLEREYRQKPAGLRTNMLIALGSALFAITLAVLLLLPLMERLFDDRGGGSGEG